jgi:FkbM family methyltransferase
MIDVIALVRQGFAKAGVGLTRVSNTLPYRRQQFFRDLGVTVVLDVGANTGQYASELRKHGYEGRLVSFEPLASPFQTLREFAGTYHNHQCMQVALGSADGNAEINVSENIVSSSLLAVSDECVTACHASRRVGTETIEVLRLDTVRADVLRPSDRVHLKIDTQGTEREVLWGGAETLQQVASIELELSLAPLYDTQPLFTEMCQLLEACAFRCVWIERGFMNESTGHTLQVDGFFVRMDSPDTRLGKPDITRY